MRIVWILLACLFPFLWLGTRTEISALATTQPLQRISSEQFQYLGAFKVPEGAIGESTFSYGGRTLAFRSDGDPDGADDGFPGSLFLVGHTYQQMVAEISIPVPITSTTKDASELNRAVTLQPFADITGGLAMTMSNGDPRIGGLLWLEVQTGQDSPKLYWTVYRWYNVTGDNYLSHGWSDVTLDAPNAQGGWRLGDYHNQMTAGYLFAAPHAWAEQNTGGKRLISGLNVAQGVSTSSQGPAMFASAPWLHAEQPPPNEAVLDTQPIVYYPYTEDNSKDLPGHKIPDKWDDGTWISVGDQAAVIVVGRVSLGEVRYGEPLPSDCDQYKGYHGDPYQPTILFYDPADLAASARGEVEPWEVLPYARWNPEAFLFPSCEWYLTGAAFDEANRLLYLVQIDADRVTNEFEPYPLIHVFRLNPVETLPSATESIYLPLVSANP